MTYFSQIAQILVAGVTNGSIYALVALGFSLVFAVNGFLSLMQGEFVMLGGLVTVVLVRVLDVPLPLAALGAIGVCCLSGALLHQLTLSPRRRLSADTALIVTLGGAFVLRGTAMIVFGKDPLSLPSFSGERPVVVAQVAIDTQSFWIVATLVCASALLWWFFARTLVGKAMLACAQSPTGARLVGINLRHIALIAFMTSAALGALAGIVATPLSFVSYDDGMGIGVKGFIAAVIGGIGSYPGAVIGGLLLGLAESLSAGYLSSEFKDAFAFVLLLVLLLVRPEGLLRSQK